ncbi:sensor histidine kinase [Konateibacter massiliensis]|uniref:sensor histidine kinase n=1 Tax=Konateibacter massiliensis TaxID=2002841 RepID=UPI0015D4FFC4|nr:sensor histidine kinase [Konateibacter massiliensis]
MKIQKKGARGPKSLNKRLLLFMILCWVVPVTVFFAFTTVSYREGIIEKTEGLMADQLSNASSFASIRIDEAVSLCQRPSYEKTWENAWNAYEKTISEGTQGRRTDFLMEINSSLKGKFYLDERFNLYAFYINGETNPGCYASRTGASYNTYVETIQPGIEEIKDMNSSYTYVKVLENRIFIIRNLYTTNDYEKFGTLVVELNKHKVFQDVPTSIRNQLTVCVDDKESLLTFATNDEDLDKARAALTEKLLESYDRTSQSQITKLSQGKYNGYLFQKKYDNYHIGIVYQISRASMYSSLYELYFIVLFMLAIFIPLISYGAFFLKRQIQKPISRLIRASKEMEDGKIGVEIQGETMPNAEFTYLMESFNSMSSQVKYLFDYVYDEKLARKDAQIQALQAQINPHFLNNTLEMMNWQARMSGDVVISKMIEALGTVLDYRMNRANVKKIHLAEELQCTDAYFYIMSMRFGQRLQIEKEIDDNLLDLMVPPLILQPIVENAIVHGIERVKSGTILVKIYREGENVYLQVRNSGKLIKRKDMEQIQALLGGDTEIPQKPNEHTSIGIRNVNLRIKLVYGEEYGLSIEQREEGMTFSTIVIPYQKREESQSEEERIRVENELKKIQKSRKGQV